MSALSSLKARTTRAKNIALTRAQIERPVIAGTVIRKLTGSSSKKKGGQDAVPATPTVEHAAHVSGVAAAKAAAGVPDTAAVLTRTDGIEAAKIAAGVPAAPAAH